MRKGFRDAPAARLAERVWELDLRPRARAIFVLFAMFASLCTPFAHATSELDRLFAFQTIGALRTWDNMDGLFGDYVADAYKDYFSRQTRFEYKDLSKTDTLLSNSKIPYNKLIEDKEVLSQLSRAARTETMLRTKVMKEGRQYRFILEWVQAPKMDLIATETFTLAEPEDGRAVGLGDIQGALQSEHDRMIDKVPYIAMVTGRDSQSITVNVGTHMTAKKGDHLVIATLDEVKRHPLLGTVVEWRLTPVGKAAVEQVDEGIIFARVLEEEHGQKISRYQKVTRILPYEEPKDSQSTVLDEDMKEEKPEEPPRLGWVGADLLLGYHDRQFSAASGASNLKGSGFFGGAKATGEIWVNRYFFADLAFSYGFGSFSQTEATTGTPSTVSASGGTSMSQFAWKVNAGYAFLSTGDFFGPKAWVKLGYRNTSYICPASATEMTAPVAFGALFAGLGGQLPIRGGWGVEANFEYGLLNGATGMTGLTVGTFNGSNQADLYIGGFYRYTQRICFRLGLAVLGSGADFSGGFSLSQKYIVASPSVIYYF